MKFLIVSLALVAVASSQRYGHQQLHQGGQQPPIAILRQSQDVSPDGSYNYNYETENGISASESGVLEAVKPDGEAAVVAEGQYRYTAPDGSPISLTYTADENGFQPQGAHLPVPPQIPEGILRALEYNAAHPEQDDIHTHRQQNQRHQFNKRF